MTRAEFLAITGMSVGRLKGLQQMRLLPFALPASDDKWARIANLMEAERREAAAKRAKTRRVAIVFFACLVLVVAIAAARTLIR